MGPRGFVQVLSLHSTLKYIIIILFPDSLEFTGTCLAYTLPPSIILYGDMPGLCYGGIVSLLGVVPFWQSRSTCPDWLVGGSLHIVSALLPRQDSLGRLSTQRIYIFLNHNLYSRYRYWPLHLIANSATFV